MFVSKLFSNQIVLPLSLDINSNLSDTGANMNYMDQLNSVNADLNEANNSLTHSLQALNILAEVRSHSSFFVHTLVFVYTG